MRRVFFTSRTIKTVEKINEIPSGEGNFIFNTFELLD